MLLASMVIEIEVYRLLLREVQVALGMLESQVRQAHR